MAVGSYNVEVTIDGKKKIIQNGFSVIVQGDEKKTAFGPYVFTSSEKIENGYGNYTLRGAVTMNGWLHFKGDVVLSGDLEEGGSIQVSDYSGSYVEFDTATAEGIGSFLAEKGVSLDVRLYIISHCTTIRRIYTIIQIIWLMIYQQEF